MPTPENINLQKISLGKQENKTSGKFKYKITPILYEKKPFEIVVYGKFNFFSFNNKSFSVGLTINKFNKDFFKSIEKRISDLYGKKLQLIKSSHGHSKIYLKLSSDDGKIQIQLTNKEINANPHNFLGEAISGRIKMKISRIYNGSCLSLICEAKEVFIKDIINKEIPYYDVLGREINYLWWLINSKNISKEDSTESEEHFSNST